MKGAMFCGVLGLCLTVAPTGGETSSAEFQAGGLAGDPGPVKSAEEWIIYGVCFEIPLNRKEQPVPTSQKSTVFRVSC